VATLFAVLSTNFLITALGSTHRSLLMRAMDFRSLELRFLAGVAAGAVVGIGVALAGFGPWALVAQELAVAAVSTALLWLLNPWRPSFTFSRTSLADLGSFGLRALLSDVFVRMNQNADNLLVGRFLGAVPLGLYALAYNTMVSPLARIVAPVQEVLYPAFSRLQADSASVGRHWLQATRAVCALCLPAMLGLVLTAPDLVPTVFGNHWRASAPVLQILAIVGALQCIQSQHAIVLRALDRTATLLRFTSFSFAANLGAFALGLHWGIKGVAASFAVSSFVLAVLFTVIVARSVGVSPVGFGSALATVMIPAGIMTGVCFAVRRTLVAEGVPQTLRLLVVVAVGL